MFLKSINIMKNKKEIPSAKDFFLDKIFPSGKISKEDKELWLEVHDLIKECINISIEHTKLHVQAALEKTAENILVNYSNDHIEIDKDSILKSYSEKNIT